MFTCGFLPWFKNVARLRSQGHFRITFSLLFKESPGARFSKVPKTFRARKAIRRKLRPAYSVKLVFSYVVKGIKIKITAKFCASRRLRFEDTKRIMSPEYARKVSGLSRNGPLVLILSYEIMISFTCKWKLIFIWNDERQDSPWKRGQR